MSVGEIIQKGSEDTITSLQLIYDYYKHITTLSLGVILFISAFLKIGRVNDLQSIFIMISIIAFLLSIVLSLWIMHLIGRVLSYQVGSQAHAQLIDKTSLLPIEKQLEELKKIGIEMNTQISAALTEAKKTRKLIKPTWVAFLFGAVFVVLYIVARLVF